MAPEFKAPKAFPLVDAALIGAAILAFFGPLLLAPFVYDDLRFILQNPFVSGAWPGLRALLLSPLDAMGAYEPLVTLAHRLLYAAAGAATWPYRLTSLLLHWSNAVLFLLLCRRRLSDRGLALAAALVFALFPAHAETLAVSTFKTHLTAGLLCLAALNVLDEPWRETLPGLAALWALLTAALFAKETAVVLIPLALASLAFRPGGRERWKNAAPLFAGWLLIAAAYGGLRVFAVPRSLGSAAGDSFVLQVLTAAKLLLWYLAQLAVPCALCFEHSLSAVSRLEPQALGLAAGAAAALAALAALSRRDKTTAFAAAWTVLALAPFLNLVPFLNFSLVSDRYLYLASAGFALLCARTLQSLFPRLDPRRLSLGLCGAAAIYAALDVRRAALFTEPLELWSQTAVCAPGNARAHAALGSQLLDKSMNDAAAAEFDEALSLKPDYWEAMRDAAFAQAALGRDAKALDLARSAVNGRPDADGWLTLGSVLMTLQRPVEALGPLRLAVRLAPFLPEARLRLGQCALALRRWDEAGAQLAAVPATVRLGPDLKEAMGDLALGRNDPGAAEQLYRAALAARPLQASAAGKLADLLRRRGRREAAMAVFDDLIARLSAAIAAGRQGGREQDAATIAKLESSRDGMIDMREWVRRRPIAAARRPRTRRGAPAAKAP
ncbi:MAG: tetratricopeptide repeat protein [Elusimicrobia bacterium]|nr:tetratricopeptide repeat protein [Elusimicrobiota bacterium]